MSDDADRFKEIEAKLARLKTDGLMTQQAVAELALQMKRLDEKLDTIILKLFEPERLRLQLEEFSGSVEAAATPKDVDDILATFLASRGR